MNGSEYLFALYIFVLIVVLFFLYRRFVLQVKGKRPASIEDASDGLDKEQRLFNLYQNIEEMMDNFEAYIEDTRDQMESIKSQMTQQADYINGLLQRVEAAEAGARTAVAVMRSPEKPEQEKDAQQKGDTKQTPENGKRATRAEAVRELLAKGLTVEQIAQKLELSINEVRLIVYGLMTKSAESK
jgi:hypothetical protein